MLYPFGLHDLVPDTWRDFCLDELVVAVRGRGVAVRYVDSCGSEVAVHLAEGSSLTTYYRRVLAVHLIEP